MSEQLILFLDKKKNEGMVVLETDRNITAQEQRAEGIL